MFAFDLMYGTAWKEEKTEECVWGAISAGFRAIDTANERKHYFEQGVGNAIKRAIDQGIVQREDLYLQTKFTYAERQDDRLSFDPNADYETQVRQSFADSLEQLGTDVIDSYVLHVPKIERNLTDADWQVWQTMESLCKEGKTKVIGVSNFSLGQLQSLCAQATVKPAWVQNRCTTYGWDLHVREFCGKNRITYQGFNLLRNPVDVKKAFQDIVLRSGKTSAQVIYRFARQVGMIPLTGTTNPIHQKEALDISDFTLTGQEIETICRCMTN